MGNVPDAVLVRVSAIGLDRAQMNATLSNFTRQMLNSMSPENRKILIGPV
jgi:hypothetical protein